MGKLKELLEKTSKKAKAERRPRLAEQSAPAKTPSMEPLTVGVPEAVAISGLSLRYLRDEIRKGNIYTVRKGRRVLIPYTGFKSYLGLN